eukprot:5920514-Pleurochrysis_carterae.AAC.1
MPIKYINSQVFNSHSHAKNIYYINYWFAVPRVGSFACRELRAGAAQRCAQISQACQHALKPVCVHRPPLPVAARTCLRRYSKRQRQRLLGQRKAPGGWRQRKARAVKGGQLKTPDGGGQRKAPLGEERDT